jgi:PhnB protein
MFGAASEEDIVTYTLTPYLCTRNASKAIDFYKSAFGAIETMRLAGPDGTVGHAELKIGDTLLMIADEYPDHGFFSPQHLNGTSVLLHLTVPNVDEVFSQAVSAGARIDRPVIEEFYGMRTGSITDPFGHRWMIGTVTEELSNDEITRRAAAKFGADR